MSSTLMMLAKPPLKPLTLNDQEVYELVNKYYVGNTPGEKFDVDALFKIVSDIMRPSFGVADPSVKVGDTRQDNREKDIPPNFEPPTHELKHIACQMMETLHDENHLNAHGTTLSILKQLSSYSWYAKAVTAMAAFALEYGNFWHLCQVPRDDMLGRSLAVLNHVHAFERKRKDLSEYNLLVKNIFEIVKSLVELESIFKHGYGLKDVPSLTTAMHDFPVYVYWVVLALVSCACHIDILLGTSESKDELFQLSSQITSHHSKLLALLVKLKKETGLKNDYINRQRMLETSNDIVQVLKVLLFPNDMTNPIVTHGLTGSPESLETAFRQKHVVLFISGLDKIEDEIRLLNSLRNDLRKDPKTIKGFKKDDFKFLWVPIMDDVTGAGGDAAARDKFEHLKRQMDWYVVEHSHIPSVCVKLIEEKLGFNLQYKQPMAPVFNSQGRRVNENAMHMMFAWGIDAFPWRPEDDAALAQKWNWFWIEMKKANPLIQTWINGDNYIFVYGASDTMDYYQEDHLDKLTAELDKIQKHETTQKADAVVNYFHFGKNDPRATSRFWHTVETQFTAMRQKAKAAAVTTRSSSSSDELLAAAATFEEAKSFLCLRSHRSGWVVISKGQNVKLLCRADAALHTCQEFNKWREDLLRMPGLNDAVESHYKKVLRLPKYDEPHGKCKHLYLKSSLTDIYSPLACPDCGHTMEIDSVTYKCCHGYKDNYEGGGDAGGVDVKIDRKVA